MTRLVVLGWGNASRGDDALGPAVLAELAAADLPGVTLIEAWQLQIEHALDLEGADLALFIDAGLGTPAPFAFAELQPRAQFTASTHALAPEAVLAVFSQVTGRTPPPAFVLCVRGEHFELGQPLGDAARTHLAAAVDFARSICARADLAHWRALQRGAATPRAA